MSDDTTIDLLDAEITTNTGQTTAEIALEDGDTESYVATVSCTDGHLTVYVFHPRYTDRDPLDSYQFDITDNDQ